MRPAWLQNELRGIRPVVRNVSGGSPLEAGKPHSANCWRLIENKTSRTRVHPQSL
jgi:hypothetical protein